MVKVKIRFLVEKPIESVFELIRDISGYQRWSPDESKFFIENKITSEGPIGLVQSILIDCGGLVELWVRLYNISLLLKLDFNKEFYSYYPPSVPNLNIP